MLPWRPQTTYVGRSWAMRLHSGVPDTFLERSRHRGAGRSRHRRSVSRAGRLWSESPIEIGASIVVIWDLSGTSEKRRRQGLRLIGYAFAALALYLLIQSTLVLANSLPLAALTARHSLDRGHRHGHVRLAAGKARTGQALDSPVLRAEGRVTKIDGILAVAVLLGLALNATIGWWWADPAAGYVLVFYAAREVREIFSGRDLDMPRPASAGLDLAAARSPRRVDTRPVRQQSNPREVLTVSGCPGASDSRRSYPRKRQGLGPRVQMSRPRRDRASNGSGAACRRNRLHRRRVD